MKKIILPALIMAILFSCKSNDSSKGGSGDKSKDNQEASSNGWSKAEKDIFINACVEEAKAGMSLSDATKYCSCAQEKVEAKYPNSADATKMDDSMMGQIAEDCLK